MKNLFLVLIIVTLVFAVFPTAIHADEVTIEDTTPIVDVSEMETTIPEEGVAEDVTTTTEDNAETEQTETNTEPPTSPEDAEVASFIDRLAEAWENGDINLVISLAFDVAIIIFAYLAKKASKKNAGDVASIFGENGAYTLKQNKTVEAINHLVDAANEATNAVAGDGGLKTIVEEFKKEMEKKISAIQELDKEKLLDYGNQLKACMASQKLIAEILQTVYANSTTIPMPVKNIINEKYVEIVHQLNGDNGGDANA